MLTYYDWSVTSLLPSKGITNYLDEYSKMNHGNPLMTQVLLNPSEATISKTLQKYLQEGSRYKSDAVHCSESFD